MLDLSIWQIFLSISVKETFMLSSLIFGRVADNPVEDLMSLICRDSSLDVTLAASLNLSSSYLLMLRDN